MAATAPYGFADRLADRLKLYRVGEKLRLILPPPGQLIVINLRTPDRSTDGP